MNLFELIRKKQKSVLVEAWDPDARSWKPHPAPESLLLSLPLPSGLRDATHEGVIRGLAVISGVRITVRGAARHFPKHASGDSHFHAFHRTPEQAVVKLSWRSKGQPEHSRTIALQPRLATLPVPASPYPDASLVIEVPPQRGVKVFLGIHKALDRRVLYRECIGRGVEIGPGPKPQILQDERTTVRYVEQATPEDWHRLYGGDSLVPVDPATWKLYVVGNANNIPPDLTALDFIFSSHVIEHLANPLGHLAYWASRLKPGGVVAAIIPDREGCKDFVFDSSTVQELAEEYASGDMEVKLRHYARWSEHRLPGVPAEEILASGRSIHVHFYTPRSMQAILERFHSEIGFRKFQVISSENHKDFFVLLRK